MRHAPTSLSVRPGRIRRRSRNSGRRSASAELRHAHQWYGRCLVARPVRRGRQELKKRRVGPALLVIGTTSPPSITTRAPTISRSRSSRRRWSGDFALALAARRCLRTQGSHERAVALSTCACFRAIGRRPPREGDQGVCVSCVVRDARPLLGANRMPVPTASRYAVAGDREEALAVERAVREHNPWIAFRVN